MFLGVGGILGLRSFNYQDKIDIIMGEERET